MLNKEKTYTTSYILPFIFENNKILSDKYGFINAYIQDINRPFLEDKICVLFKYTPKTNIELDTIAKNNPYFYDHKELHINGELYDEYIYVIPPENKITIDEIINGYAYGITYKNKAKIIAFWNDFNSKHMEELLRSDLEIDFGKTKSLHELKEFVPEEDYIDYDNVELLNLMGLNKGVDDSTPLLFYSSPLTQLNILDAGNALFCSI